MSDERHPTDDPRNMAMLAIILAPAIFMGLLFLAAFIEWLAS